MTVTEELQRKELEIVIFLYISMLQGIFECSKLGYNLEAERRIGQSTSILFREAFDGSWHYNSQPAYYFWGSCYSSGAVSLCIQHP